MMSLSFLTKAYSFVKKDIITDTSYRLAFLTRWIGIFISVVTFYYLARLFEGRPNHFLAGYGGDYFSFVLIGLVAVSYLKSNVNGFIAVIVGEQCSGTLEVYLTSPTRWPMILLGMSLYNVLMGALAGGLFLVLGVVLGVDLSQANWLSVGFIMILATVSFLSLGMMASSFIIVFKRGDPVTWVVTNFFWLLGGAYFPISVFPEKIQQVACYIPSTYVFEGLRRAWLQGYTPAMLKDNLMILGLFSLFLFLLNAWIMTMALTHAKKTGSVVLY